MFLTSYPTAQLLIPGRVSDVLDFLSNCLSVLIGNAFVRLLRRGKYAGNQ